MSQSLPLFLAETHRPLFGNPWLALLAILGGVAVLMIVVRQVGCWLAATHPVTDVSTNPITAAPDERPDAITLAIIAATVATVMGERVRIEAIHPASPPNGEPPLQQWSTEGRRQIYSSHQIR